MTLSDGINTPVPFSFNIIITPNTPPMFSGSLANQNVVQGHTLSYTLPATSDVDSDTVSVTSSYPSFVTFAGNTYTISPLITDVATSYSVSVTISDGINPGVVSSFNVIVAANSPPTFTTTPLAN